MHTARKVRSSQAKQHGFTLTELAIATIVLLFGVMAVIQLVPSAMQTNQVNRYDTTSVVIAQHYLDIFSSQPLINSTYTDTACGNMSTGAGTANTSLLVPALSAEMSGINAIIDWTQPATAGYNCPYVDPNSPTGETYQMRWAVVTTENAAGVVTSKRFIVSVWRQGPQFRFPVTLEATADR